ncbi:MAG: hypothetical protein IJ614_03150 [Prevotella sp.]|nr:hypothetical protein [Prevotella sp.]
MKKGKNKYGFEVGDFNELEKIRIYMEYHKDEVFTLEFMEELAQKFLNYYNVRKKIKELYPRIVRTDIKNNVSVIPNDYEQVFKRQ